MLAVIHKIICLLNCNIISISFMRNLQKLCVFWIFTRLEIIKISLNLFEICLIIFFIIKLSHSGFFLNFIKLSFFIFARKLWDFCFFTWLEHIIIVLNLIIIFIIIWVFLYLSHSRSSFNFIMLRFFIIGICIIIFIITLVCLTKLLKSYSTFLSKIIFRFNLIMLIKHIIFIIIVIMHINNVIIVISGWCILVLTI